METPTLREMGINNPDQIVRYQTRQKTPRRDVLKITYKRKHGSILPVRRVYEFGRAVRTSVVDSGAPLYKETYEVSPIYQSAIAELDALLNESSSLSSAPSVAKADNTVSARALALIDELEETAQKSAESHHFINNINRLRVEV